MRIVYTGMGSHDNPIRLTLTEFQERFALRIRRLRETRGLRQEDLESYGLAWRSVQNLEYGTTDPKISTLLKVCEAFGVTLSELLKIEEGAS